MLSFLSVSFIAFLPITDNTDMGISVPIPIPISISVHLYPFELYLSFHIKDSIMVAKQFVFKNGRGRRILNAS